MLAKVPEGHNCTSGSAFHFASQTFEAAWASIAASNADSLPFPTERLAQMDRLTPFRVDCRWVRPSGDSF